MKRDVLAIRLMAEKKNVSRGQANWIVLLKDVKRIHSDWRELYNIVPRYELEVIL
ncbi:MAG: hypothetical protein Kow00121_60590 [Elainellaceae cyanobacterium]